MTMILYNIYRMLRTFIKNKNQSLLDVYILILFTEFNIYILILVGIYIYIHIGLIIYILWVRHFQNFQFKVTVY